jgi:Transport and Golgi organisation 2
VCTVSWIHQAGGYHLLCNRDEKRSRGTALPPRVAELDGVRYIAPTDADGGGFWIAVNEFGLSLCLLNGHPSPAQRSRGLVIRDMVSARSVAECLLRVKQLDVHAYAGFTLVALEPRRPAALVQWNGGELTIDPAGDSHMPLTSSAYDPAGVRRSRLNDFARLGRSATSIDPALLHKFHVSHGSEPNAYSTCMHRPDAATVSFSWVAVTNSQVRFVYLPGAPCQCLPGERNILARAA